MKNLGKSVALLAAGATLLTGMALPVAAQAEEDPENQVVRADDLELTRLALLNIQRINKLRTSHRTPLSAEQIAQASTEDSEAMYGKKYTAEPSSFASVADDGNPLPPLRINKDMMKWAQHRADMLHDHWDGHDQTYSGKPSWYQASIDVNDPRYKGGAVFGPEALVGSGSNMYYDSAAGWASEAQPGKTGLDRQGYGHYLILISPFADIAGLGISCTGRGEQSLCVQALEIGDNTNTKQPTESVEEALAEVDRQLAARPDVTYEKNQATRSIRLELPSGQKTVIQTVNVYRRGKTDETAAWSKASWSAYTVPKVNGYTSSMSVVPAQTIAYNPYSADSNPTVTVTYSKNKPVDPSKPDDQHKHDSGKPTNPSKPNKPSKPSKPSKPVTPASQQQAEKLARDHRNDLQDGTWVMRSDLGSDLVLDVAGATHADGGNVQLYAANGTQAQEWTVSHDAKGFVSLKNQASCKLIDLSAAVVRNGRNIDQYHFNGTLAQKWVAVKSGNGVVLHSALNPDYVLDVSGGARRNNANVQLYTKNGSHAQKWIPNQTPETLAARNRNTLRDGQVVLRSGLGSNLVMDLAGATHNNGGNVQLYAANGTRAQEWTITHDHTGFVTLKNRESGKVLDLSAAAVRNGRNIDQWAANGTQAQKWIAIKSGNAFSLHSALNPDYVLDVSGGARRNNANVQLYRGNSTSAQKWTIGLTSEQRADQLAAKYKDVLADNEYTIYSRVDDTRNYGMFNRLALDLKAASHADSANIQIYHKNGSNAQKWIITHNKQGYVMLRNKASGKMLDLSAAIARNGRNIDQYHANGTRAQEWVAVPGNHGISLHSAVNPDYVLDVTGAGRRDGTNVQLYRSNGSRAQAWNFIDKDGWTTVDGGYHGWVE